MQPLLIVTLESRVAQIDTAVRQFAHPCATPFFRIMPVSPDWGNRIMDLTRYIDEAALNVATHAGSSSCMIVVDREVQCNKVALRQYFEVDNRSFKSLINTSFVRDRTPYFLQLLNRIGLSNSAYAKEHVRGWSHAVLTDRLIDSWLEQFTKIGYPWIGEGLLCQLEVISSSQLGDVLAESLEAAESDFFI